MHCNTSSKADHHSLLIYGKVNMSQVYKFELAIEIETLNISEDRNQDRELEGIKVVNELAQKYVKTAACTAMGVEECNVNVTSYYNCNYESVDLKCGNLKLKTSPTLKMTNSEIVAENKTIKNAITAASALIYSEKGNCESLSIKLDKNEDLISDLKSELNM